MRQLSQLTYMLPIGEIELCGITLATARVSGRRTGSSDGYHEPFLRSKRRKISHAANYGIEAAVLLDLGLKWSSASHSRSKHYSFLNRVLIGNLSVLGFFKTQFVHFQGYICD
jgi:hypothetical protein